MRPPVILSLIFFMNSVYAELKKLVCDISTEEKIEEFLSTDSEKSHRYAKTCRGSEYGLRRIIIFDSRGFANENYESASSTGKWCWGHDILTDKLKLSATESTFTFHYIENSFDFKVNKETLTAQTPGMNSVWQCKIEDFGRSDNQTPPTSLL